MSNIDDYSPATSLASYYPGRTTNRLARHWAREVTLHNLADIGLLQFFEGGGSDPTVLPGYAKSKLWMRVDAGVTSEVATIRYYAGGDETLLASWPEVSREGISAHIGARAGGELDLVWSTTTSGDPGDGRVRGNNATLSSITEIAVSVTGRQEQAYAARLAAWGEFDVVRIYAVGTEANYVELAIAGEGTSSGTYWTFPVTVRSATTLANGTLVGAENIPVSSAVVSSESLNIANVLQRAPTRTDLKAIDTSSTTTVFLAEPGREGLYYWDGLVTTGRHQADTEERDLIAPNAASAGAWVRAEPYGPADIKTAFLGLAQARSGNVVLRKVRSSGAIYEHHVFTQLGDESETEWACWMFSNHANGGSTGGAEGQLRMAHCTRALLQRSRESGRPQPVPDAGDHNLDVPYHSRIWATGDGTETGTFASATVSGLATRYSTTVGDTVEYTVRGISKLSVRGYGVSANGGVASVAITAGGSPISGDLYVMPDSGGKRLVDFRGAGTTGLAVIPLADGLDPATEYVVTLTVDTSNPASGRMYQGGLVGWGPDWKTTAAIYGGAIANGSGYTVQRYVGETIVYECANVTKIGLKHRAATNAGIANIEVYDTLGNAVPVDTPTIDCYAASTSIPTTTIVSGLPRGTYYLHVIVSGTKNASSSAVTIHHAGLVLTDEGQAGDPSVDDFDILDGPEDATSAREGTSHYIGNDGSNERVFVVRAAADPDGSQDFIGGVHGGEEITGAPVFKVDGVVVDFAGAAVGDKWVGKSVEVTYTTNLLSPHDSAVIGTADYSTRVTAFGYESTVTDTLSEDCVLGVHYSFMLTYESDRAGTIGVGGGFGNCLLEPRGVFAVDSAGTLQIPVNPRAAAFWNDNYVAVGWPIDFDATVAALEPTAGDNGSRTAFVANNHPSQVRDKFYIQPYSNTTGATFASGSTWTCKGFWGVAKVKDFGRYLVEA